NARFLASTPYSASALRQFTLTGHALDDEFFPFIALSSPFAPAMSEHLYAIALSAGTPSPLA
ncbi:MAG: hypothetical protein ACO3SO_12735, partial [Luteolibacter sp.]